MRCSQWIQGRQQSVNIYGYTARPQLGRHTADHHTEILFSNAAWRGSGHGPHLYIQRHAKTVQSQRSKGIDDGIGFRGQRSWHFEVKRSHANIPAVLYYEAVIINND